MRYDNAALYYMTGTGNTRRVALWMADAAQRKGVTAEARSIEEVEPTAVTAPDEGGLLGILMPTHGFTAPWLMMKFVARLPRGRGGHAFCVTTRASTCLPTGSRFTRGSKRNRRAP